MTMRAARAFPVFVLLFLATAFGLATTSGAAAVEARRVVTTENSDYFGFDLRSEQNVSLDQCQTSCLGDQSCRAFTYNTKAKWCFLKSDFALIKPFTGAVAGKVVPVNGEADIGAPAALSFFPASMVDEARQYRSALTTNTVVDPALGLAALIDTGEQSLQSGDGRTAMQKFRAAAIILPDDAAIWTRLARATATVSPINGEETASLQRDTTSSCVSPATALSCRRRPGVESRSYPSIWRRPISSFTALAIGASPRC
jgi:hypothetical protein